MDANDVATASIEALRGLANEQILDLARHREHIIVQRDVLAQQHTEIRASQVVAIQQEQNTADLIHQITQSQAYSQHLETLVGTLQARVPLQIQQLQDQNRRLLEQVQLMQEFINSSSP
jgi:hypothetical protein